MKKILIIENEYPSIKDAFDIANQLYFNNQLTFINVDKSQSIHFDELSTYYVIFLDISLSQRSELDGWGIIEKFKRLNNEILKRTVIITGNNKIDEALKEKGLSDYHIHKIIKPIGFQEIFETIQTITENN